jgi:hypothetical protein
MTATEQLTEKLLATRAETLPYFALPGEQLALCYAPGKWSVGFLLHHLADAETVLLERIRRTISEPRGVLWAFDQDAWAVGLGYTERPLELSRAMYQAARAMVIYEAERHYDNHGGLEFIHSESGLRTLKDEFDKVAAHNAHHLAQIRAALGQSV